MAMHCFSLAMPRRRFIRAAGGGGMAVLVLLSAGAFGAPPDAAATLGRDKFVAAVLAKVPPYVRWPDAALGAGNEPFVIGLLGKDPLEELLVELVKGLRVGEREIVVQSFAKADQVLKCQILFVPASKVADWEATSKTAPPNLLVVGETEDIEKSGGVLWISPQDGKLHVFLANAKKTQLDLDARLLKISKVHR